MPTRSITLTTTLHVPFARAFAYLADPKNQAEWAVHFIKSVRQEGDVVLATTPMGELPLRVASARELGVLDIHLGDAPPIPARLVPSGDGCEYIFTLGQPPGMPDDVWTNVAIPNMREELDVLKKRLERGGAR